MKRQANILNQAEVWVDRSGVSHDLDGMDPNYRASLIPFLRGNCRTLYGQYHRTPAVFVRRAEAEDWLEQTPLMRRLCALESGRSIDERRATAERNADYERRTGYRKVRLG